MVLLFSLRDSCTKDVILTRHIMLKVINELSKEAFSKAAT